ncbi:hypothetical protein L228DRAFT_282271 [Xylona heveae TC161]|uniref:Uncharacterized protein n=1 Tax=Xylona heveae (strain CBS 132557 / TC161) TaxID=1328760 RepID=A0A165HI81_XYLHT|nr:hypothetical protein L228DRAFT_282271 [Xylona heveae TC161]KZF23558.1 hypothetical protein L228DRAFT_282271 [Xylona heveae TC161]
MKFGLLSSLLIGLPFASQLVSAWSDGTGGIASGYFSIKVPQVGKGSYEPYEYVHAMVYTEGNSDGYLFKCVCAADNENWCYFTAPDLPYGVSLHPGDRCFSDDDNGVQIKYGAQYLDAPKDSRCSKIDYGGFTNTAARCIIPVGG